MAQVQVKRNDTNAVLRTESTSGSCLQDAIDWAVANTMASLASYEGLTFECQGDIGAAQIYNQYNETGTAQAGTSTSITLAATANRFDGYYCPIPGSLRALVQITSGTGTGQSKWINAYNGTTKVAEIVGTFSPAPDNTSVYKLSQPMWTAPDAAYPVIIQPADGYWHNGTFDDPTDGAYISLSGAGKALVVEQPYVTVRGLRVNCLGGGQQEGITSDSLYADYFTLDRCIVDCHFDTSHSIGIRLGVTSYRSFAFNATLTGNIVRGGTCSCGYVYCILCKCPQASHAYNEYNSVLNVTLQHNTVRHAFSPSSGALTSGGHGICLNPDAANVSGSATVNVVDSYNNVSVYEGTSPTIATGWDVLDDDANASVTITDSTNNADNDGSIATYVNGLAGSGDMTGTVTGAGVVNNFTSATDFRLISGASPTLIGAGSASASVVNDAAQLPYNTPPSIGAFEFVSSSGGTGTMGLEMDLLL